MSLRSFRGIQLIVLIAILFGVIGTRLAWLQLGFGSSRTANGILVKQALLQHSDDLQLDHGRGQFRDRTGRLLTGATIRVLAAFPDNGLPRGSDKDLQFVATSLGISSKSLEEWLMNLREPAVWKAGESGHELALTTPQAKAIEEANLLGVAVLPYRNRYPEHITPIHAIGYISQHPERIQQLYAHELNQHMMSLTQTIGGAGLERSMDRLLQGIAPTTVTQVTDASRLPLEGLGLRISAPHNPHFPLQVTTTLDLDVQQLVEETLQDYGVTHGAAVVLDTRNADILAMASLPRFNPYHLGADHTDERNYALAGAPPGSIFKTVTLAAALESEVTTWDEEFNCGGHYGKYGLRCWKKEGHGRLSLRQAYAESCNLVFAQLAERMDPAWLQITGERLGLGRVVGWHAEGFMDNKPLRLLEEEEAGTLFLSKALAADGGVRAGTGIGQRDVRVTPLQAANMIVTILHRGKVFAPRLVKDIRYSDGGIMTSLPVKSSRSTYGEIEAQTADFLMEGMLSVVQNGTASKALAHSLWPLAGKSGTAELAGKKETRNDHWFMGYGPANDHPRYAIAIYISNQPAGANNRAASVFGDLMDGLYHLEERWARKAEEPEAGL